MGFFFPESVPNPDHRTLKMMEFINSACMIWRRIHFCLDSVGEKELAVFWRHFRKGDPEMQGIIGLDQFYELFHEKRSIFGDGIFDLCDIHHADELEFGEYLVAVIT